MRRLVQQPNAIFKLYSAFVQNLRFKRMYIDALFDACVMLSEFIAVDRCVQGIPTIEDCRGNSKANSIIDKRGTTNTGSLQNR